MSRSMKEGNIYCSVVFPTDERLVGFLEEDKKNYTITRSSLVDVHPKAYQYFTLEEIINYDPRLLVFIRMYKEV